MIILTDIRDELSALNTRVESSNSELSTISSNSSPIYDNGDICDRLDKIADLLEE
ncbi:MAG TPA: hypothetical protein VKZ45_03970 [Vicingaceae bacterium]|nr:hypothetical protein [Vicingaceae bacterium]